MNRANYIATYGKKFYEDERWMIQHTMRDISFVDQGLDIPPNRTIDNGLTATTTTLKLGGALTANTEIEVGGYSFFLPRTPDYFSFVGVDYTTATSPEFQVFMCNESTDDQTQIIVNPTQFEFLVRGATVGDYVLLEFNKTSWLLEFAQAAGTGYRFDATTTSSRWQREVSDGVYEGITLKTTGVVNLSEVPAYADNAAALAGGLVAGDLFRVGGVVNIVT